MSKFSNFEMIVPQPKRPSQTLRQIRWIQAKKKKIPTRQPTNKKVFSAVGF